MTNKRVLTRSPSRYSEKLNIVLEETVYMVLVSVDSTGLRVSGSNGEEVRGDETVIVNG